MALPVMKLLRFFTLTSYSTTGNRHIAIARNQTFTVKERQCA